MLIFPLQVSFYLSMYLFLLFIYVFIIPAHAHLPEPARLARQSVWTATPASWSIGPTLGRLGPPPWRATSYPRGVGLPTVKRFSLGLQIIICRPDERGGGQGGPAPRGPGVWGAREESKNTVVGQAGFFFFFDRKSVHGGSRILIRGGPPKKNVGLATLGMM